MRFAQVLVVVAAGVFPVAVYAQDSRSEVARRDLLERAERARSSGDHAAALTLAMQAAQIRQTPSLRLMLAQEHRTAGHLVEALDHATACVREAQADVSLRNREQLVEVCRTLAAEVEPSIGRLTVRVTPASAAGLRVRVGDTDLPTSLLGVPSPVMPGRVAVRVEAHGFRAASRDVVVAAGSAAQVDVALDAEGTTSSNETAQGVAAATATDSRSTSTRGPGAGPWVVVGLGAAGVAAGVALFVLSNGAQSRRDDACGSAGCQESARADDESYRSLLYGADVAFGIGGAAVAGGLIWWLAAPRGRSAQTTAAIVPSRDGVTVQIGGSL